METIMGIVSIAILKSSGPLQVTPQFAAYPCGQGCHYGISVPKDIAA